MLVPSDPSPIDTLGLETNPVRESGKRLKPGIWLVQKAERNTEMHAWNSNSGRVHTGQLSIVPSLASLRVGNSPSRVFTYMRRWLPYYRQGIFVMTGETENPSLGSSKGNMYITTARPDLESKQ